MFSKRVFVLACLGSLNREPTTETEQSIMGHLRGLVKVEDRCCFSCTCLLKNPADMFFVNEVTVWCCSQWDQSVLSRLR